MKDDKLKKIIEWIPAFDKTNPDPKKNYGIGSMKIKFILKGKKGAVQFLMATGWHLPEVQKRLLVTSPSHLHTQFGERYYCPLEPKAYDIGYHSYEPMYEDQEPLTDHCPILDGKPCYYDGSSLQAEEYLNILISKGEKELWGALGKYYVNRFYNGENREMDLGELLNELSKAFDTLSYKDGE